MEVHEDGTARVCFAGADAGTGQAALLRQIAAEELGLAFDDVSVTMMDSHDAPQDLGAWSSRGTMWSGHATADAARGAARALKEAAAAKFGVASAQVTLVEGEARSGADAVPIGDLVALADGAQPTDACGCEGSYLTDVDKMDKVHGRGHFSPAYSFCVQAVEVEVDYATGQVKVVDAVTVHDSGAALNPAAAEGQAVGAMAMGLGRRPRRGTRLRAGPPRQPELAGLPSAAGLGPAVRSGPSCSTPTTRPDPTEPRASARSAWCPRRPRWPTRWPTPPVCGSGRYRSPRTSC